MIGAATSPASQPQPKSAAGDANLVSATSLEGTKVFFYLFVRDSRQFLVQYVKHIKNEDVLSTYNATLGKRDLMKTCLLFFLCT
jgi:hypothetical protein